MDYLYTKTVNVDKLQSEILAAALPLTSISTLDTSVTITMSRSLIAAEQTALDTTVTNHITTGWAPFMEDTYDVVNFNEEPIPTAPALGLKVFNQDIAGRQMFSQVGKSGVVYSFQPSLARNSVSFFRANGNAATYTSVGIAPTGAGTATARTVATTNIFTSMKRTGFVSSATAASSSGLRAGSLQNMMGNAAGVGGYLFIARFGISDAAAVAGARLFVGFYGTATVIGNVEPSTLVNVVGIGADSTDTTLQLLFNDNTANCTKVALPATFPTNTRNTDMFELAMFVKPNGVQVGFLVTNLTSGATFTYTATTNIPASATLLGWQLWRNNNTTALAVGLDIASVYIETDN